MALNIIKISRVSPATNSVEPLILPLTFFDLVWLKLRPTERVTFYRLTESSPGSFCSVILPKLERSLSLALTHFLPLSGHLKWDPQDPKPHIVVFPQDAVSLTVAETSADFSRIAGKGLRPETDLRALVPELPASSDSASVLSLQITLFPNQGFCIGTTSHHAVIDGQTASKFHKTWAHICKYGTIPQDFHLPMLLDRSVINVPAGLEPKILQLLSYYAEDKDMSRTLNPSPFKEIDDVVRITLDLTQENVDTLKEKAKNESTCSDLHLSTFVVTFAYVWTWMVKARGGDADRPVLLMYVADFRNRLDPPVPETYFGNCVLPIVYLNTKRRLFWEKMDLFMASRFLAIPSRVVVHEELSQSGISTRKEERASSWLHRCYLLTGLTSLGYTGLISDGEDPLILRLCPFTGISSLCRRGGMKLVASRLVSH